MWLLAGLPRAAVADEGQEDVEAAALSADFHDQVDRQVDIPEADLLLYSKFLHATLASAGIKNLTPQLLVLVDRNPNVQAVMILLSASDSTLYLIGAAAVSTGRPGSYESFETPLGVFRHGTGNPDFRAEGVRNSNGILGYGPKGARIYDFGWQLAPRTWDKRGASQMRLQMHSTDTELLEPRIGTQQSKGCIRIPLSLNHFIDHYGILDADYEEAVRLGSTNYIWPRNREPTQWSGRYMIVVDSARNIRPDWASLSDAKRHAHH